MPWAPAVAGPGADVLARLRVSGLRPTLVVMSSARAGPCPALPCPWLGCSLCFCTASLTLCSCVPSWLPLPAGHHALDCAPPDFHLPPLSLPHPSHGGTECRAQVEEAQAQTRPTSGTFAVSQRKKEREHLQGPFNPSSFPPPCLEPRDPVHMPVGLPSHPLWGCRRGLWALGAQIHSLGAGTWGCRWRTSWW